MGAHGSLLSQKEGSHPACLRAPSRRGATAARSLVARVVLLRLLTLLLRLLLLLPGR